MKNINDRRLSIKEHALCPECGGELDIWRCEYCGFDVEFIGYETINGKMFETNYKWP